MAAIIMELIGTCNLREILS